MTDQHIRPNAGAAGTFDLGGDLSANRMGFGAMRITGPGIWGEPEDPEEARAVLRRAVEFGVNLIDTADSYGPKVSERLIAETLHPYPEGLVIATKGGLLRDGPGQWRTNGEPYESARPATPSRPAYQPPSSPMMGGGGGFDDEPPMPGDDDIPFLRPDIPDRYLSADHPPEMSA